MGLEALVKARTHQPCAACRMLRKKCDSNCILAPYFPSDEIEKFAGVHKVFGASNVIKMIQMLEETKREDAAKALVYEATARIRDPVYGCTGAIFQLQKMVQELEMQLESTKTRVLELQQQNEQLLSILLNVNHLDLLSPIDHGGTFSLDYDDSMAYDQANFPGQLPLLKTQPPIPRWIPPTTSRFPFSDPNSSLPPRTDPYPPSTGYLTLPVTHG
ncbi:hypothetical protein REPUB_Repub12eG0165500 [Reevesia pubescens]